MSPRPDIAAEGILLAGAGRAILLQIAQPTVGSGVANHSDFAGNPMARLQGTLSYVYAVSGGSEADVTAVREWVNRAHAPVPGATDPSLQLWVAATLYDTAIQVYERVYGTMEPDTADRVYRGYAELGVTLQMPPEMWPADRAAFASYFAGMVSTLAVDASARRVCADLFAARNAPWWVRLLMPVMRFVTAGLLPARVRDLFGLTWTTRRQRRFERLWAVVSPVYRVLPAGVRHWPKRHYLSRLRRSAAR